MFRKIVVHGSSCTKFLQDVCRIQEYMLYLIRIFCDFLNSVRVCALQSETVYKFIILLQPMS